MNKINNNFDLGVVCVKISVFLLYYEKLRNIFDSENYGCEEINFVGIKNSKGWLK